MSNELEPNIDTSIPTNKFDFSIKEWTFNWLTPEQRKDAREMFEKIKKHSLELLGDNFFVSLPAGEEIIEIFKPHGGAGYDETEVIVEIRDAMNPTERELGERKASYLFFEDFVINKPNHWIATKTNTQWGYSQPEVHKDNAGSDNYEVGQEELNTLHTKLVQPRNMTQ